MTAASLRSASLAQVEALYAARASSSSSRSSGSREPRPHRAWGRRRDAAGSDDWFQLTTDICSRPDAAEADLSLVGRDVIEDGTFGLLATARPATISP
jgi:hypothetical protein